MHPSSRPPSVAFGERPTTAPLSEEISGGHNTNTNNLIDLATLQTSSHGQEDQHQNPHPHHHHPRSSINGSPQLLSPSLGSSVLTNGSFAPSPTAQTSKRDGDLGRMVSDDSLKKAADKNAAKDGGAADRPADPSRDDSCCCCCSTRWLPRWMHAYGHTTYGGNPVTQQTLPAVFNYPPIWLSIIIYLAFAIIFLVVGSLELVGLSRQQSVEVPYSNIHRYQYVPTDSRININEGIRTFEADGVAHRQGTRTVVRFHVHRTIHAPVSFYYVIDNMYQNFRSLRESRDVNQLRGKASVGKLSHCEPFSTVGFVEGGTTAITITNPQDGSTTTEDASSFTYNPCGSLAWNLFNDSFILYKVKDAGREMLCNASDFDAVGEPLGGSTSPNHCTKRGISFRADRDVRFAPLRHDEPHWWSKDYSFITNNEYLRNGWYLNEAGHALPDPADLDLQVWMKTGLLSNFMKLHRFIHLDLHAGTYEMEIDEFYDVVTFDGTKSFKLMHAGFYQNANAVLGAVFIALGVVAFVLGITFLVELMWRERGVNRYERLPLPKRNWYVFDAEGAEVENYYERLTWREVPMKRLEELREAQDVRRPSSDEDD